MLNQNQPLTTMITFALQIFQCPLLRKCFWQLQTEYMNLKINSVSIMHTYCMFSYTLNKMKLQSFTKDFLLVKSFVQHIKSFNQLMRRCSLAHNCSVWETIKGTEEVDQLRYSLRSFKNNLFQQFYLFLQKFQLGTFNQELKDKFGISIPAVSCVFLCWSNLMYFAHGKKPIWPSREKIQKHMSECFKHIHPRYRGIIDASEIKTKAPSSLVLNSELYSAH